MNRFSCRFCLEAFIAERIAPENSGLVIPPLTQVSVLAKDHGSILEVAVLGRLVVLYFLYKNLVFKK